MAMHRIFRRIQPDLSNFPQVAQRLCSSLFIPIFIPLMSQSQQPFDASEQEFDQCSLSSDTAAASANVPGADYMRHYDPDIETAEDGTDVSSLSDFSLLSTSRHNMLCSCF